eukprot:1406466-Amphidinium_carterae.1
MRSFQREAVQASPLAQGKLTLRVASLSSHGKCLGLQIARANHMRTCSCNTHLLALAIGPSDQRVERLGSARRGSSHELYLAIAPSQCHEKCQIECYANICLAPVSSERSGTASDENHNHRALHRRSTVSSMRNKKADGCEVGLRNCEKSLQQRVLLE